MHAVSTTGRDLPPAVAGNEGNISRHDDVLDVATPATVCCEVLIGLLRGDDVEIEIRHDQTVLLPTDDQAIVGHSERACEVVVGPWLIEVREAERPVVVGQVTTLGRDDGEGFCVFAIHRAERSADEHAIVGRINGDVPHRSTADRWVPAGIHDAAGQGHPGQPLRLDLDAVTPLDRIERTGDVEPAIGGLQGVHSRLCPRPVREFDVERRVEITSCGIHGSKTGSGRVTVHAGKLAANEQSIVGRIGLESEHRPCHVGVET